MNGMESAAAAILAVQKVSSFPVIGRIDTCHIVRAIPDGTITHLANLSVRIDGQVYTAVTYSGAFLAEIIATATKTVVNREVKIELIGRQMNVAYTINTGS